MGLCWCTSAAISCSKCRLRAARQGGCNPAQAHAHAAAQRHPGMQGAADEPAEEGHFGGSQQGGQGQARRSGGAGQPKIRVCCPSSWRSSPADGLPTQPQLPARGLPVCRLSRCADVLAAPMWAQLSGGPACCPARAAEAGCRGGCCDIAVLSPACACRLPVGACTSWLCGCCLHRPAACGGGRPATSKCRPCSGLCSSWVCRIAGTVAGRQHSKNMHELHAGHQQPLSQPRGGMQVPLPDEGMPPPALDVLHDPGLAAAAHSLAEAPCPASPPAPAEVAAPQAAAADLAPLLAKGSSRSDPLGVPAGPGPSSSAAAAGTPDQVPACAWAAGASFLLSVGLVRPWSS